MTLPPAGILAPPTVEPIAFTTRETDVRNTLMAAGVDVRAVSAVPAPQVVTYRIELGPGVAPAKVQRAVDSLALTLETPVRYAGVSAGAVVVEATRDEREMVPLTSLHDGHVGMPPTSLSLGRYTNGSLARFDLHTLPHLLVAGTTGCIHGDAEIIVNRAGIGKRMKLRDLVRKFNHEGRPKQGEKPWRSDIVTRVQYRADDGTMRSGILRSAWFSGVKETFAVTTASGRVTRATATHPFLTENGWKTLGEIKPGDRVHVRDDVRCQPERAPKPRYKTVTGLRAHPYASRRQPGMTDRFRHPLHIVTAEATLNGVELADFIAALRGGEADPTWRFVDSRTHHVHHIDHDHLNNDPSNLEILTAREHHAHHAESGGAQRVLYRSMLDEIISIEPHGLEETFDLEMLDEPHNFVADGFVVHNSGKSTFLTAMLTSLLLKATPEQVKLVLVDPKRVELAAFAGAPHLMQPIVSDVSEAMDALRGAVAMMDERYARFEGHARDITAWNALHKDNPLPRVLIVVDELSDMMMRAGKQVEPLIVRIAQLGRAAGIHLVLATQRPAKAVFSPLIVDNIPARVTFAVADHNASKVALGHTGAEKLAGHGDGLYKLPKVGEPRRFQSAFVSEEDAARVVKWWRRERPEAAQQALPRAEAASAVDPAVAEQAQLRAELDAEDPVDDDLRIDVTAGEVLHGAGITPQVLDAIAETLTERIASGVLAHITQALKKED